MEPTANKIYEINKKDSQTQSTVSMPCYGKTGSPQDMMYAVLWI